VEPRRLGAALFLGVAVVVLAVVFFLFGTGEGMGGMMGGGMALFMLGGVLATVLVVVAVILLLLPRDRPAPPAPYAPPPAVPADGHPPVALEVPPPAALDPVSERRLVAGLPEDQRRLYVRIHESGGAVLQRDIVRWDLFSPAKVTRLLDRMEARGLVVRERQGMTNRVRLVSPPKQPA